MTRKTEISQELCADEAVCFIADRHNVTPQQLLHYFLAEGHAAGALTPAKTDIPLEANEIEILKALSALTKD